MSCRRHTALRYWLLLGIIWAAVSAFGQSAFQFTEGALQKKHIHERFLRLVEGGDGNFYAFKGSAGHYWQFGAEGERGLQIIRLSPALSAMDTLKIKRLGPATAVKNVYEVLVAPQGIGLLSIRKAGVGAPPQMELCIPDFSVSPPATHCETLAEMPGLNVGLDKPFIRLAYNQDSSFILIAWRRLAQEDESDRSLACMILDRNLKVVQAPFSPFKQFTQDIWLKEILLLDAEHILFTAQTMQAGNVLTGPSTISYGMMHYAVPDDELRIIRFRSTREVPVETRLGISADGHLIAAGWYLDQSNDRSSAGAYIGRITGADTLEDLHQFPFSEPLRAAVIRQEKRSGAVGIRTGFHSALLNSENGHAFILHLRGDTDPGLTPSAPSNRANNTLHCWTFDQSLELVDHTMSGFYNFGREDFLETFSWRPMLVNGKWKALATDFSKVQRDNFPIEAQCYVWSLPGTDFEALSGSKDKDFCLLAPRLVIKVSATEWVGLAIAGKRWRLVRLGIEHS